ncbi:MAG: thiol-disulfide oxidoreductase DCC family protein [Nitrospiraceae bacterium]
MMAHESTQTSADRILIYDGQCRFCVTAKEGLERAGNQEGVRFVPYQSEEAARRLGNDYQPGRPAVAFLVDQDGRVSRGLDAFLPLLPGLPGGRVLHALMKIPLIKPLAYLAYRVVARYRYRWFGQMAFPHCSDLACHDPHPAPHESMRRRR